MDDIKEILKTLVALQEKDTALDGMRAQAQSFPVRIRELKDEAAALTGDAESRKKNLVQLQLKRKEREADLQAKEAEIRKHGNELNAVKTNEAYRALLSEIERGKKEKSVLETDILEIMDALETESSRLAAEEGTIRERAAELQREAAAVEEQLSELRAGIAEKEKARAEFARQVPANALSRYEGIRESRQGIGVAPLLGETCGVCHFQLRPQLINDLYRGREMIVCDNCQRIVYRADKDKDED